MMTQIRKLQDTWFAKSIFILTALSFMSLFGISGYLYSAGKNRTVIKVDDIEISQNEIAYKYDKQLQLAKNLFGTQIDITDDMRNQILLGIVRTELVNAIIQTTADDFDIVIGDDLIRKIVYSQSTFMGADGKFDINRFKFALSQNGLTEQEYINNLRLDLQKKILAYDPAQFVNVPDFIVEMMGKIENQKRIFDYVVINPEKIALDRKISADELEQYYHDFSDNFMAPEKRDVSFMELSVENIEKNYKPSQEEVDAYYQANIELFEQPEKRDVLQMLFQNKEDAQEALNLLNSGQDFLDVAQKVAKQNQEDTKLGEVSKDMMLEAVADEVFLLNQNEVTQPLQSDFGWHLFKVTKIIPAQKMNADKAHEIALKALRQEKSYEAVADYIQSLEDKIGAGETLDNLAKEAHVSLKNIKNLAEDGSNDSNVQNVPSELIDQAFSYNVGEVSQVVETDTGLLVVRVDNVTETHLLDLDAVKPQIEKMWANNERDIIAQELSNDIMNDLENGGNIAEAAQRFHVKLLSSSPIKRSESFGGLSSSAISALFQSEVGYPKLFEVDNKKIIAVTKTILRDNHKLSDMEKATLKARAENNFAGDAANALVDDYASSYDVRVKYKLLGLAD